ncbi:MAG: prepilin-type N-terminal cleavage/methylation domain-containing protein [Thermoguttaceae bacterium]|nr:prepilin-type N-terminal cleavage/methylation domain-containing protein [Thermoguttaceae bacterium]
MSALTINRRTRSVQGFRRGLTLLEIMAAVMVLCIGLVGVLAAIPFGGFRLSQMNEADYSSLVGRDAARIIRANGWANPNNWFLEMPNGSNIWGDEDPRAIFTQNGGLRLNLCYPFLIDPLRLRYTNGRYQPLFFYRTVDENASAFYTSVAPKIETLYWDGNEGKIKQDPTFNPVNVSNRYERIFYLPDDMSDGYGDSESESEFRPFLETETDSISLETDANTNNVVPSFTGRYSWAAMVYPKANEGALFTQCSRNDISYSDYDIVVFKDRDLGEERFIKASVVGSGYQGGTVDLDLSSMFKVDQVQNQDSGADPVARVIEQLEKTKYIALTGTDDIPVAGDNGSQIWSNFTRWYRVANYSVDPTNRSNVRLTLIGPNTPRSWLDGGRNCKSVVALFFPGAVNVVSGSSSF